METMKEMQTGTKAFELEGTIAGQHCSTTFANLDSCMLRLFTDSSHQDKLVNALTCETLFPQPLFMETMKEMQTGTTAFELEGTIAGQH